QAALVAAAASAGGGFFEGEHAALEDAYLEAEFPRCGVAALHLPLLAEQRAGQDLGPGDALPAAAALGVDALDGRPSAEQVFADGVPFEDLRAGLDDGLDHNVEPIGTAVPGQDSGVGAGRGEFVVAAAAVLPAAVVLVPPGQQLWFAVAQRL